MTFMQKSSKVKQATTSTEAEETRAVYVPLAERFGVHIWKTEFEEIRRILKN